MNIPVSSLFDNYILLVTGTYFSQILTDWQDKKGDKRFLKLGKDADLSASSRHKPKKQKLDGKGSHGPGPGPGRPKSKNLQPKVQEYELSEDPQDIPRNPKNDAPNRSVTITSHTNSALRRCFTTLVLKYPQQ